MVNADPRESDLTFVRYLIDLENSLDWVLRNLDVDADLVAFSDAYLGGLPYDLTLRIRQRPGTASASLNDLQLSMDASLSRELTVLSGGLYACLEYVCSWDLDTCTSRKDLLRTNGWHRSDFVLNSRTIFEVGQIAAICDAVAMIPKSILDCGNAP